MSGVAESVPIIDVEPLVSRARGASRAADAIGAACRRQGFFYAVGHGVSPVLQERLESLSRGFFALAPDTKLRIRMERGGRAWRGYFPVGGELTSGLPDQKEGLYFGAELGHDHPEVSRGTPLHGPNLFPEEIAGFRETVLEYLAEMTRLAHHLMEGIAMSLGLEASYFNDRYTKDPLILFRIFHYPPLAAGEEGLWSVGEHTDYGVLTILRQSDQEGLEVKVGDDWIEAPPVPGSFVCNIGDMLDRMTGGVYRSTPHRVRNESGEDRLSFPFFFDPNWNARVEPIEPTVPREDDRAERWDGVSVVELEGTYGDYLMGKIAKVFPALGGEVL